MNKYLAFRLTLMLFLSCFSSLIQAAPTEIKQAGKSVVVGVIDDEPRVSFEEKILPLLQGETKGCALCEVRNFSPYDKEGNFLESGLAQSLALAKVEASFLFLSWNRPMAADHRAISDSLKKLVAEGFVVIATTGAASADQSTLPLNRTVVGQVPGVIIIGELVERDNLLAKSFFGPEMLTAVRPPKEFMGQGHGPLLFASRLATNWSKKPHTEWPGYLKATREKSRKLWPSIEDFF